MKLETANLLKAHFDNNKFEIVPVDKQLEFNHELTDAEILEIVEAEYGTSIVQPVPDLFLVILKDLVKIAIEFAKDNKNEKAD